MCRGFQVPRDRGGMLLSHCRWTERKKEEHVVDPALKANGV